MNKIKYSILICTLIFNHCKLKASFPLLTHPIKDDNLAMIFENIGVLITKAFDSIVTTDVKPMKKKLKYKSTVKTAPVLFLEKHIE